jgi:hypothetical protein
VAPTENAYDCRPYTGTSDETCDASTSGFDAHGPGQFYVAVRGYGAATVHLRVDYTAPGATSQSPAQMVDCMRFEPGSADSPYSPPKVGIYAAAAHLGWFEDLFRAAFPPDGAGGPNRWSLEYGKFRSRVSMPKGNHPRFTQDEFDVIAEWFARGLPELAARLPEDGTPSSCTTGIGADMSAHVNQMASTGWTAVNLGHNLHMYGCPEGTTGAGCLTALALASSKPYGSSWTLVGKLRVLRELTFNTFFWMRSSADGRFVANGASTSAGAMISDLQSGTDIPTHAAYDPGFFPDNLGFVFQGTTIGAAFCSQSLLESHPTEIQFTEAQCRSAASVGLYQHLGAALDGGDYFVINSQFTSDNGGGSATLQDPTAGFASGAEMKLTPMVNDGSGFTEGQSVAVSTPYEGDVVLSPSTRLAVSRLAGPNAQQLGYVFHKVNATRTGTGYAITAPEVGRICVKGGKPAISFDERHMVFHHYVEAGDWQSLGFSSATDPTFVALRQKGASNIFIADLLTGQVTRVTNMSPGQYALYPHFRSDGWFYFLVRDSNTGKEYAIASDAAFGL